MSTAVGTVMAPVDRAWLRMDEPANLMIINGVMVLDRVVPVERIRAVLTTRLLAMPRFSERVGRDRRGRHIWEPVTVDINAHVAEIQLAAPGDDTTLEALVSGRMSDNFDPSRPLWTCDVVQGHHTGTALLWRIHHCIGDGIALMLVMLALTDLDPEIDAWAAAMAGDLEHGNPLASLFTDHNLTHEEAKGHVGRFMPEAVTLLTRPAEILLRAARWKVGLASGGALAKLTALPPDPKTIFKGKLGRAKRVAWSAPIPVSQISGLRHSAGGTVNDILTTAVAGSLRRYLLAESQRTNLNLRAVVPVSLRPIERMADLGNEFGLAFLPLPIGIDDPRERLVELRRRMGKIKSSAQPLVALWFLRQLGKLPHTAQNLAVRLFGTKGTAVMTNVPGPRERLAFGGALIRDMMFWVPQSGRLAMGISILSYAGEVRLGIVTDAGLVPEPQRLIDGFIAELDRLAAG